uniref:Uncharacterized protein n=1 Tax=Leptobrachium leishanense TaxID=445787 RepID=A0A8C5R9G4_9ANUR
MPPYIQSSIYTNESRFDISSIHPESKKPGSYTQVPYCRRANSEQASRLGPGSYEPAPGNFSPTVLQRKASGPGWKRELETKRLSQMPHFLFKETQERNRLLKQSLGPGSYNIKSFSELLEEKPSSERGVCSTRDVRFKDSQKVCYPGPGTYGIPHRLIEDRATKSASNKGLMEGGTAIRQVPKTAGSGLGPGTYKVESCIDETLEKVVGKRGPYDLFSGSRDQPVYGHIGSQVKMESEPGQYKMKSFTEEWESEHKKKRGFLGRIAQYPNVSAERLCCSSLVHCPRPANSPGPGYYDVKSSFPQKTGSNVAFLCSAKRFERKSCRLLSGSAHPVGVGRYDITKELHGKTTTCYMMPFLSKTGRYFATPMRGAVLQERIRYKNRHTPAVRSAILHPASA